MTSCDSLSFWGLQLLHVSISRRFAFEELEREPFFENEEWVFRRCFHSNPTHFFGSPSYSGVDEFTYLEQRSRYSVKGLYRPEKPKYRMASSDSTVTLDLVSSTDEAGEDEENSDWDFWRWFAWHNPQGLWADWKGTRRWWALH